MREGELNQPAPSRSPKMTWKKNGNSKWTFKKSACRKSPPSPIRINNDGFIKTIQSKKIENKLPSRRELVPNLSEQYSIYKPK